MHRVRCVLRADANADGGDAAHYADIGAVYLLKNRVQLDARVGFGLNKDADNVYAGVGISFLFAAPVKQGRRSKT